ncbi:hypothetical protein G9A89_014015 [Geosiphon pyriformis]|nr:hypothetical protein G9A89_014015 [Geosiphon pyriformis]
MAALIKKLEDKIEKSFEKHKDTFGKHTEEIFAATKSHLTPSHEKRWENWAGTIAVEPELIFRPRSLQDLKDIVKKAKKNGKKIRCVAQGHTFNSLSVTNDYLVIVQKLDKVNIEKSEKFGWVITAEAGATIKQMDDALRSHNPPLAFNSMTVLDSVRASGVVSTGSHGAKVDSSGISDNVIALKILTADGELHEFSDEKDPIEMSAARVSLGLLGIIYNLTFRVEPIFSLRMIDSQPQLNTWLTGPKLKKLVETSDSVEIFYWPFNENELDDSTDKLWIKQWVRTEEPVTKSELKLEKQQIVENLGTKFGDHLYDFIVKHPEATPHISHLLWKAAPISRPSDVVLQAPDAIHYQAGIENIQIKDLEFSIKVDQDFKNIALEFRHIVTRIYELAREGKFPCNLTAEMRIVKSSSSLLSPGYDKDPNALYAHMEVLSVKDTIGYDEFSSELSKRWMEKYRARPHWGKLYEYVPGIKPYLREQLAERVQIFEKVRAKYDPEKRFFDNKTLEEIFYGTPTATNSSVNEGITNEIDKRKILAYIETIKLLGRDSTIRRPFIVKYQRTGKSEKLPLCQCAVQFWTSFTYCSKTRYILETHAYIRVRWCKENKNKIVYDWAKVISSDETSGEIGKQSRQPRVWRHIGEILLGAYFQNP